MNTTTYFYKDGESVETTEHNHATFSVDGSKVSITFWRACSRCGGAGGWTGWPGYTCFLCRGINPQASESVTLRVYTADQIIKVVARNAAAAAKREAKADAKHQASMDAAQSFLAANGIAAAWPLFTAPSCDAPRAQVIVQDIVAKLVRFGSISPAQIALVAKLTAELAAPKVEVEVAPVPVTDERVEIIGKVVSFKTVESQFGTTLKMLVVTDKGWKVFGAVPAGVASATVGTSITFHSRIERDRKSVV